MLDNVKLSISSLIVYNEALSCANQEDTPPTEIGVGVGVGSSGANVIGVGVSSIKFKLILYLLLILT